MITILIAAAAREKIDGPALHRLGESYSDVIMRLAEADD
jgi:hypothetical protein